MIEFKAWPKIPRLKKDMVVTEKIDGTNAAVIVQKLEHGASYDADMVAKVELGDGSYLVGAQSRNKLIRPGEDNAGFAAWAFANAAILAAMLGPGHHYGEWWGSGVQRRYGMDHKVFSLFNVNRYPAIIEGWKPSLEWAGIDHQVRTVPHLYSGPFDVAMIEAILADLREGGSEAAPGFMNPEGVVVYHAGAGTTFKAFVEDTGPKGQTKADYVRVGVAGA
jgi:hypothetical protein